MTRHARLHACLAVAAIALAASGCGGGTTTADPREIIKKAETAMAQVSTLHFEADANGQMVVGADETALPTASGAVATATPPPSPDASGSAASTPAVSPTAGGSPIPAQTAVVLNGAHAEGDIDFQAQTAHVTGKIPSMPGVSGELIIVGGTAFTRGPTQQFYQQTDASTLGFNPADPSSGPSVLQAILSLARDPNVDTKLVATETCIEGDCYHIQVDVSKEEANKQLGSGGIAVGQGTIDLWILTGSDRVAMVQFQSSDPQTGTFVGRLAFTNFGKTVNVQPPPAGEVAPDTSQTQAP